MEHLDKTGDFTEDVQVVQDEKTMKPDDSTLTDKQNQNKKTLLNKDEQFKLVSPNSEDNNQDLDHTEDLKNAEKLPQDATMGDFVKEEAFEKKKKKKVHRSITEPVKNGIPGQEKNGEDPASTLKTRLFTKMKSERKISSQKYPCYIPKSKKVRFNKL